MQVSWDVSKPNCMISSAVCLHKQQALTGHRWRILQRLTTAQGCTALILLSESTLQDSHDAQ